MEAREKKNPRKYWKWQKGEKCASVTFSDSLSLELRNEKRNGHMEELVNTKQGLGECFIFTIKEW